MQEKNYNEVLQIISRGLKEYQDFFAEDYYLDFEDRVNRLKERITDSFEESRLLRIGIVGEVKAGKSSFLNALIFDGQDILPKASTPMTAALTKISYSETPKAKIVFYTRKDWERVQEYAQEYDEIFQRKYDEYCNLCSQSKKKPMRREEVGPIIHKGIPLKYQSCKELTNMAFQKRVNLSDYLGEVKEFEGDHVGAQLENFIGADGEYTAIVKHVELQMDNELLQGVEIVDTPGMNDPIISRGETTKKFLGECDVVFLLSYCGQFLSNEDIQLMSETLPNEGIRQVVIVGSKFDSGILDDSKHKHIIDASNSSKSIYDQQARENINKCLASGSRSETMERIRQSLPPNYISSLLYSCARKTKKGESFNEAEKVIIDGLKRFEGFTPEYGTFLSLSGINQIKKEKVIKVIKEKNSVIEERNRELLKDNKMALLKIMDNIQNQVISNMDDLQLYDKEKLQEKLESLQYKLNSMRREIRNIFENSAVDAERMLNKIAMDVDAEIDNYMDFKVDVHYDEEVDTYRTGFLGLKKETRFTTITTYSASVSDVIQNMRGYIVRCKKYANDEFQRIVNIHEIKEKVTNTVIGAFDMSEKDFNENDILIPLEIVLKKITIPQIHIEVSQFENLIVDAFSGATVKGDQIHELRLLENRVLGEVSKAIQKELDTCLKSIQSIMSEQSSIFVDNIIALLTSNLEMLKKQIDDKENSIAMYKILRNHTTTYKKMIQDMEM